MRSFGIPEADAAADALQTTIGTNAKSLQDVAIAAVTPLNAALTTNGKLLNKVPAAIKRSLSAATKGNVQKIGEAAQTVAAQLISQVGAINSAMAGAMTGLGIPVELSGGPPHGGAFQQPGPVGTGGQVGQNNPPGNSNPTVPGLSAEGWYCIQPECMPVFRVLHVPPVISVPLYQAWGPFSTEQEAAASCTANGKIWAAAHPLGTCVQPGPTTAAANPTGTAGLWYCCLDETGTYQVWSFEELQGLPAGSCQGQRGPFATKAEAQACAGPPGPPPPVGAPVPIPPPADGQPPAGCPAPTAPGPFPASTIPGPPTVNTDSTCNGPTATFGSDQFCLNYNAIVTALAEQGTLVINWINTNATAASLIGTLPTDPVPSVLDSPLTTAQNFIISLLNKIARIGYNVLGYLQAAFQWVTDQICNYVPCNASQVLSLWIVKMTIKLLKQVQLGTDLALWATAIFSLEMPQLEEMLDRITSSLCPVNIPSIGQSIECRLKGTISKELYTCWVALNGGDYHVWEHVLQSSRQRLSADEIIDYGRRTGFVDAEIANTLSRIGWINPTEAASKVALYDRIPTQSEIVQYISTGADQDAYANAYNLDMGFDASLWAPYANQLRASGITQRNAQLAWRAHWNNPSGSQLQEMLYRLRPDKPGVTSPFTLDDFSRLLAVNAVSPYFRPLLSAIAYRLVPLRQIRNLYQTDAIDATYLQSYYQDTGHSSDDADRLVRMDTVIKRRQLASQGHGWTTEAIAKASASGLMSPQQVLQNMLYLGFTQEQANLLIERAASDLQYQVIARARSQAITASVAQVKKALEIGIIDVPTASLNLQGLGFPQNYSDTIASLTDAAASADAVRQAVQAIRRAFLSGEVDNIYATQSLANLGLTVAAVNRYIGTWGVQQTPNRRRRTASQIITDLSLGHVTTSDAIARLANLGYNDADTRLFLADAQGKAAQIAAKEQAADLKAGKAQEAALLEAANAAKRQAAQLLRALEKQAPVAKLNKWAALGFISHSQYLARMKLYGYTEASAELQYKTACAAKGASCTESAATQPLS
jgi:hypothetical protein